ncbi:hypothetical protein Atai01_71220 [Amycolatopsis taiwanensis]|uniref:Uncharacterized protein n=1 Tax=Amycolatopsis taiwanensis TaxID=342230 RepID=A0A9W6R751_9PSEU|nr:hypothetical protein Atai01_71220 [Amycolatopsis taiwanensis]
MTPAVSTRGWQGDHRVRRRQAPLSRRQGAIKDDVTRGRQERPGDTIAVARKLAEDTP